VLEGDRIVAAAGARDFRQWWGGRELGTLSSLYTGSLSAWDAVAFGLVDKAAAPGLARLFSGPAPWMYDFF
jgi:hypothetical protein